MDRGEGSDVYGDSKQNDSQVVLDVTDPEAEPDNQDPLKWK